MLTRTTAMITVMTRTTDIIDEKSSLWQEGAFLIGDYGAQMLDQRLGIKDAAAQFLDPQQILEIERGKHVGHVDWCHAGGI